VQGSPAQPWISAMLLEHAIMPLGYAPIPLSPAQHWISAMMLEHAIMLLAYAPIPLKPMAPPVAPATRRSIVASAAFA